MTSKPKGFADLADLPENERIRRIAQHVKSTGDIAGVVVDDWAGKAERYRRKLEALGVDVLSISDGPVRGTTLVRVGPRWQAPWMEN